MARPLSPWLSLLVVGCAAGGGQGTDGGRDGAIDTGRRDTSVRVDAGGMDSGSAMDGGGMDSGPVVDTGTLDGSKDGAADAAAPMDASVDATVPVDAGPADTGPADTGSADTGSADTGVVDSGPPPTPSRGIYRYYVAPIGGLRDMHVVEFHPDGTYALVLERNQGVRVYDWSTSVSIDATSTRFTPGRVGGTTYFEDVVFDPSGDFAIIVGWHQASAGAAPEGVLLRFDDAAWRAGSPTPFTFLPETRAGENFVAIEMPWDPGPPIVLSRRGSSSSIATLRQLDTATGRFAGLVTATPTSAGCDDLAFVNNEFGTWGVAVVCGSGSADARYYTEISGVGEWRPPPAATLGNTSRIDAYPGGAYALAIGWSGRRVHRFEGGAWRPTSGAPWFTTDGIWGVKFQQEGQRALIVGRAGGSPLDGTVFEYRHNLYSFAEFTDVSVPGFAGGRYLADGNTYLSDAAFRPGCDGGLIVGGKTDFRGSFGQLIEFHIEGARSCQPLP